MAVSSGSFKPKPRLPIRVDGNVAYVPVGDRYALIDASDVVLVENARWHLSEVSRCRYACCYKSGSKGPRLLMHRVVLGLGGRVPHVDHINGDGLDNRRSNLRLATAQENLHNSRLSSRNTSGYKGVSLHSTGFLATIMVNYVVHSIGPFKRARSAARAYDTMAVLAFGEFAMTNVRLGLLRPRKNDAKSDRDTSS